MVDPTLVIRIDRTSLGLAPLVASASDDGTPLGIVGYSDPAIQARVTYAGESQWVHGSTAISGTYQQSVMGIDLCPTVATEADLRTLIRELRTAISRLTFPTVVEVNGIAETWRCDMGSIGAVSRDLSDLQDLNPVYPVTIPVYPIPGA